MRATISAERTRCLSCGLETRTSSDGMCVECWADKRGRGRTPFYIQRKAGEDPIDAGWLVSAAWWALGVLVSAVIGVFLYSLNG